MGKNNAGVPQGLILGLLLFLIYINDLSNEISLLVKLFADDTSLFLVVWNKNNSALRCVKHHSLTVIVVKDKVSDWTDTWKMSFNSDPSKKHEKWFFQGSAQKRIILAYISIIYQSPRLPVQRHSAVSWWKIQLQYSHKRET